MAVKTKAKLKLKRPVKKSAATKSPGPSGLLRLVRPSKSWVAAPLETLSVVCPAGTTISVLDGEQREYVRAAATPEFTFRAGGALGTHTIRALNATGRAVAEITFELDAQSNVDDGGRFGTLFSQLVRSLQHENKPDGIGRQKFRGKEYRYYVPWILDHAHTAKGQQYLTPYAGEFVDVLRQAQRDDGMIWSFGFQTAAPAYGYHYWAYKDFGYAKIDGDILFARQPVEQHCEYNFVDTIHLHWKGSGNTAWMKKQLDAASKALDFNVGDRARWSERFQLLKRGCTIDSWDFQARDKYAVHFPMGGDMLIDADKTKFVIFFGDNQGYATACEQLAEMLTAAGRKADAEKFRTRGREIRERLDALTWTGRYFLHHVEDDPTVVRDFGVDESKQVVMSNAYALNRGISHEQARAILNTYLELKENLPSRGPAEWFSIYPPYERGFGGHGERWQYMNAGVQSHMAGELARGACEHGFERYGADILSRVSELAERTDGIVHFAYTGAWEPPPPPQQFTPLDLGAHATMDLSETGAEKVPGWMSETGGNDMRGLPVGAQEFAGVPYAITDPAKNGRRAVIAVAHDRRDYPQRVEIPVGKKAASVYLVHTCNQIGPSKIAGSVEFIYADGSSAIRYMLLGQQLSGWWFPGLGGPDAGVAWRGANGKCGDVGPSWVALANPKPDQEIAKLVFGASAENAIYAVIAVTLADRAPYHEPGPISYGGPDCWSGGLCLHALMEGVAGVKDAATAFRKVRLSPRWTAAGVNTVSVVTRYAASNGYVAYTFSHDAKSKTLSVLLTGGGTEIQLRLLLPDGATGVKKVTVGGKVTACSVEQIESSRYAVLPLKSTAPTEVRVVYSK